MLTHFNLHQFHSSRTVLAKMGLGVNRLAALGLGWVHPTVRFKFSMVNNRQVPTFKRCLL